MDKKPKKTWTKPEVRSIEVTPDILKEFLSVAVANDLDSTRAAAPPRRSRG